MPHTLLGICTTCPCPMGYPKPSPRGRYRSKSEGKCTLEYYHVCHQVGPRNQYEISRYEGFRLSLELYLFSYILI